MNYHKKFISAVMSFLICLSTAPTLSYAEETTNYDDQIMPINIEDEEETATESKEIASGDYIYTVDDSGYAHITEYRGSGTDVVIPDTIDGISVTEINAGSFLNGTAETIYIPASIEYISADNPFAPCLNLTQITVDENNAYYCAVDGVLFTKDMKKLVCYPPKKEGTSYTVPDGIEQLGIASIAESGLKEIILPDSLNQINRHAMSFNESLEKIDMSGTSVEIIDVMAFAQCTSLKEVIFSESTTEIGLAAFISCQNLAEVTLPDSLEYIEQSAFMDTAIEKVRIPDNVSYIGYSAFGYDANENPNEDFVIIGKTGSAAQTYATDSDSEYNYENNFTFIASEAADAEEEYNAMNPVVSSDGEYEYSVLDDGTCCILFCVAIDDTITVPEEIDGYKVKSIYKGAFLNNEASAIILPETVETIGEAVFSEYVQSITISGNCTSIEGNEPFISCTNLKEINVTEGGSGTYSSQDGVLYNKDKTVLIAYPVMKEDKEFKVPSTVTEIDISAFCYNTYIENVDLSSVSIINSYAFEGCTNLKDVTFGNNLNTVGNDVFLENTSLMSVRLPSDIETIGDYAFGYYYNSALAKEISENESSDDILPFSVIDGFKIYADENSLAWQYAQACGIEVITNTAEIGGKNVDKNFLYVTGGIAGAAILAVIGIITGKNISKKKKKGKKS